MRRRTSTARRIAQEREAYWNSPQGRLNTAQMNFSRMQAYGWTHDEEVRHWGQEAVKIATQHFPDSVPGILEAIKHFEDRVAAR